MKNEKNYLGFLIHKNIANFEAFRWNILLSANLLFLKSTLWLHSPELSNKFNSSNKCQKKFSLWSGDLRKKTKIPTIEKLPPRHNPAAYSKLY